MKKTKQEIINEINKSFSFLCWPYWMDRKGRIHEQAASFKRQAASFKRQASSSKLDRSSIL
jgi:hypothetical protein